MRSVCDPIVCLCNSPQRLRILKVLDGERMNVRDLMAVLGSPRSTVQRNLSVLEEQGWVESVNCRYKTTITGELLREQFVAVNKTAATINRMAPFFAAVETRPDIDIEQLTDVLVTTPDSIHPNAPTKRLSEKFSTADCIRGFVPIVSSYMVELFQKMNKNGETDHEYVLPRSTLDTLRTEYGDSADGAKSASPKRTEIFVYDDDMPYGLIISNEQLALMVYDNIGRIDALVESATEAALEWGEQMYKTFRDQSTQPTMDYSS